MKLSSKTIAAIKLFVDLGEHYDGGSISLLDVAERKDLSKKFLEQIVPLYKSQGLLLCTRGNQGGYRLAKSPKDISLQDIVYPTESFFHPGDVKYPPIEEALKELERKTADYFAAISLSDLIEKQREQYAASYVI